MNNDFRDGWNEAIEKAVAMLRLEISTSEFEAMAPHAQGRFNRRLEMVRALKLAVKDTNNE